MSEFDVLFALLSLLLGLSIAELLSGFARVLRLKARERAAKKGALSLEAERAAELGASAPVRVGWLVPLLGAYVLVDQLSFLTAAWAFRDTLPVTLFALLAITVVVGGYYLAATLIFPDEPADWPDFDRYYDEHKRFVLGFALFAQGCQLALNMAVQPDTGASEAMFAASPVLSGIAVVAVFATFPLLIAALRATSRRGNTALLGGLVALRLVVAVLSVPLSA